ncbi:MAG: hypothetical protein J5877_00205 [Clostridia bacterium]|nr:hypothetical protein [Clostridia bacterium]
MEYFSFAKLNVAMNCRYPMLKERSRKYLLPSCENITADIEVDVTSDIIDKYEKTASKGVTRDMIEYALAGEMFYRRLLSFDGMLLHSSVVEYNKKAYLFSANSGVGKSTHTHLWLKYIEGTNIINDDKPAIRLVDGVYNAFGTPFSGKCDESMNIGVPVGAICFIERATENKIRKISPTEIVPLIYQQTTQPIASPKHMDILFGFLDGLLRNVPVYKLSCDISREAVKTSFEELTGEKFPKENDNED